MDAQAPKTQPRNDGGWLAGGGEMAARVGAHDWSVTPLGPLAQWPVSLRTAVNLVLAAGSPMVLCWGDAAIKIYNDAYAALLGEKHPKALGAPLHAMWPELRDFHTPVFAAAMAGQTCSFSRQQLSLDRGAGPEDGWFDLSYGPVRDEEGRVQGVLVTVAEHTAAVRSEAIARAREERLRTVLESTTDCVFLVKADGTIVFQNARAVALMNEGRSLIGQHFYEAFPGFAESRFGTACERTMRAQRPSRFTAYHPPMGLWLEVHAYPTPEMLTIFFRDVTEDKRRAEEREQLLAAVKAEQEQLRAVIEQMPIGVTLAKMPTGEIAAYNSKAVELLGHPMLPAKDTADYGQYGAVHGDGKAYSAEEHPLARTVLHGETVDREELAYRRGDGRLSHLGVSTGIVRNSAGTPVLAVCAFHDISERKEAETRQRLLLDELNHRVKNTLATVLAISQQTLQFSGTREAFAEAFSARIMALSHTHSLLTRDAWQPVRLRDLLETELSPFRRGAGSRFTLDGPDATLPAKSALALGLAFHELATNAAKYGALSAPEGRVEVRWQKETGEAATLDIEWRERGGPAVTPPRSRGFGSTMIERGLAHDLGGEAKLEFAREGVRCRIRLPLKDAG